MKAYSRHRNKGLYRNGLAVFLEYRLTAVYGAYDLILSVIRNAVDRIMQITQETSSDGRSELNKEVSVTIVRLWKNVHVAAIKPSKHTITWCSKDTDDARLLCLVVGMGRPDLLRTGFSTAIRHGVQLTAWVFHLRSPFVREIYTLYLPAARSWPPNPGFPRYRHTSPVGAVRGCSCCPGNSTA